MDKTHVDKRSQGGYLIFFRPNLKKQQTVARSIIESGYRVWANVVLELTWEQSLFGEVGLYLLAISVLWCDNVEATYLSTNPIFHASTKHVDVDFHFVRDKPAKRYLQVQFISTKDQREDILTKKDYHQQDLKFYGPNLSLL